MIDQFQEALNKLLEKLGGWLDSIVLAIPNLILAAIVLIISIFLSRKLKKFVRKAIARSTKNKTVTGLLTNLSVAIFMFLAIFIVLNILDLSDALTAMLGTAGVVGLAVGLALQDPLVNLFSGVLMSVRDYYKVGDLIESNGFFGKIQKINLRTTVILTPDGQEVVIPNKDVLQNPLKNYSHTPRRRIDLSCGVAYGDDLEKVKEVAVNAIKSSGLKFNKDDEIEHYFTEFGDSSINFVLRFWQNISAQGDYLAAQDKAIIALKKAFDANDITIPFPIRTLDFGVVGGMRIDDIYEPEKMSAGNGNGGSTKE